MKPALAAGFILQAIEQISINHSNTETHLNDAIRQYSIKTPIVNYLNSEKFQEQGYFPFSLSLLCVHEQTALLDILFF